MNVTIYWEKKCTTDVKGRIKERFNIPSHTTINGETACVIADSDMKDLREEVKSGFIQIRNK